MNPIPISYQLLSAALWERVLENATLHFETRRGELFNLFDELDGLRAGADYNTGSVSATSGWVLYALAYMLAPVRVAEVGTFIGRSTLALAHGMDAAGVAGGAIHTCDVSNAIQLPMPTSTRITQYSRQSSTEMLRKLATPDAKQSFDMAYLDGRLDAQDVALLSHLLKPEGVIGFDDFEGVEKGVANVMLLRSAGLFPGHALIYPCKSEMLLRYGLTGFCRTALLVPLSLLRITPQ
jgi:hypothetical protein